MTDYLVEKSKETDLTWEKVRIYPGEIYPGYDMVEGILCKMQEDTE